MILWTLYQRYLHINTWTLSYSVCVVPVTTEGAKQLGLRPVEWLASTRSSYITNAGGSQLLSRDSRPSSRATELSVGKLSHITTPEALIAGVWETPTHAAHPMTPTSTAPKAGADASQLGVSPQNPALEHLLSSGSYEMLEPEPEFVPTGAKPNLEHLLSSGTYEMPEQEPEPELQTFNFHTSVQPVAKSAGPRGPTTPIPVAIPSPGRLLSFQIPSPALYRKGTAPPTGSGLGCGLGSGTGTGTGLGDSPLATSTAAGLVGRPATMNVYSTENQRQHFIGDSAGWGSPRPATKVISSPRARPPTPPPLPTIGPLLPAPVPLSLPATPERSRHETETISLLTQLNRYGFYRRFSLTIIE